MSNAITGSVVHKCYRMLATHHDAEIDEIRIDEIESGEYDDFRVHYGLSANLYTAVIIGNDVRASVQLPGYNAGDRLLPMMMENIIGKLAVYEDAELEDIRVHHVHMWTQEVGQGFVIFSNDDAGITYWSSFDEGPDGKMSLSVKPIEFSSF